MAELNYHFGLKVRIYPSDQQKAIIKCNSDASRFIYNQMVGIGKELSQLKRVKLPIDTVQQRIKQLKARRNARQLTNHFQFLDDKRIDSLTKANAIQNYRKAWHAFRKVHTAGVPNFHHKSYVWKYQTNCQYPRQKVARLTNGTVRFLDHNHVMVPKLGRLRVKGSHQWLLDLTQAIRIGTVTLTKNAIGQFFLSMQVAADTPFVSKFPSTKQRLGIDLNTENFLTDSHGHRVANPRYYRTIKTRLAKAQRKLARRMVRAKKEHRALRTIKNYQKQRLLVAKLQHQVYGRRQNFLQQLSMTLIKNHDLVVAEELRSQNLLKNHALAMSISDVGWRTFLMLLAYKAELYGRTFVTIDPRNTTQTCYTCGFVMGTNNTQKLSLKDRHWQCPRCGAAHIRDWNAANNILAKGIAKLAQIE